MEPPDDTDIKLAAHRKAVADLEHQQATFFREELGRLDRQRSDLDRRIADVEDWLRRNDYEWLMGQPRPLRRDADGRIDPRDIIARIRARTEQQRMVDGG